MRLATQALEPPAQQVDQDHPGDTLGLGPVAFADAMADEPGIGALRGLRVRQRGRFECTLGFHGVLFPVVNCGYLMEVGLMSEQALRQEIVELRARIEAVDDWAAGVHRVLADVLPFLLRGHPEAAKVHQLLQQAERRYEELSAHPDQSEGPGETADLYEPAKLLNRQLALQGVWPGVDPQQAARESVERAREARR